MILLWGLIEDPPMASVANELHAQGAVATMIDQAFIDEVALHEDVSGATLVFPHGRLQLDDVHTMYLRPYDVGQIPGLDLAGDRGARARRVEDALMARGSLAGGVVLNPPDSEHLNNSKPAQLGLIARYAPALSRPATVVTTCPEAMTQFVGRHGRCIVKSVSGHRSRVRIITHHDLDGERLDRVRFCPVQIQQWVPGTDFRVHVVGCQTFATAVDSEADDYRYERADLRSASIPAWVSEACVALAVGMGLGLAGVDLRRSDEGEWYCFEVNPSPAFTYYEQRTGQHIAAAIAELLMSAA